MQRGNCTILNVVAGLEKLADMFLNTLHPEKIFEK